MPAGHRPTDPVIRRSPSSLSWAYGQTGPVQMDEGPTSHREVAARYSTETCAAAAMTELGQPDFGAMLLRWAPRRLALAQLPARAGATRARGRAAAGRCSPRRRAR